MRFIGIFLIVLLITYTRLAADPQQPKVGGTPVINATNGYAGILTVRTQMNVGYPNQSGVIALSSTNGTYTVTLSLDASGTLTVAYGTTNMLTLLVGSNSGYGGTGNKVLTDNGAYQAITSPPGAVVTNININPTDGYLPYRSNSTVFGNSPFYRIASTSLGLVTTNRWLTKPNATTFGIGQDSMKAVTTGNESYAVGSFALQAMTSGTFNNAFGYNALTALTDGADNNAFGFGALGVNLHGFDNTAIGSGALANSTVDDNTAVGYQAGNTITTGINNVYIGSTANASTGAAQNEIAIGYGTTGRGNNTATLGNASVVDFYAPLDLHLDRSATNVLSRSTTDLVYTNGSTTGSSFRLVSGSGSGSQLSVGHNSGDQAQVQASGSILVLGGGGITFNLTAGGVQPGSEYYLGGPNNGNWFSDIGGKDVYAKGFYANAGTDFSYAHLSHSGTNGFAILNSQSGGTAGTPKPWLIQIGSTNKVEVDTTTTAGDTALLLWDVTAGSLVRVSRGASDSGGAGFRLLRIPN